MPHATYPRDYYDREGKCPEEGLLLVRVTGLAGSVGIWYLYSTESKAKVSQTMLQCRQKSVGDENREGINKHVSAAEWRVR